MQFGRVYGFVTRGATGERWLTVSLDTGREVRTIRDEAIPPMLEANEPAWLADQLVQRRGRVGHQVRAVVQHPHVHEPGQREQLSLPAVGVDGDGNPQRLRGLNLQLPSQLSDARHNPPVQGAPGEREHHPERRLATDDQPVKE